MVYVPGLFKTLPLHQYISVDRENFYSSAADYSPMRRAAALALLIGSVLVACFSLLAVSYFYPQSQQIKDQALDYNFQAQNATAKRHGSDLAVSFNYANLGLKSLTIQRFLCYGANNESGGSGSPHQQNIPNLQVAFNGTSENNPENFTYTLHSGNAVLISISIPNYEKYINGTYIGVEVIQKEIVSGFPIILID
jgi:hypothetical protein